MRCVPVAFLLAAVLTVVSTHGVYGGRGHWQRVNQAARSQSLTRDGSQCGPGYSCTYAYHDPTTSKTYTYDFSSLCQETDYVVQDAFEHTYYANICGQATHNCLPVAWRPAYKVGAAVMFWGPAPPCNNETMCKDNQGKPACCTPSCEVLGVGPPQISLIDSTNPATGGVRLTYIPVSSAGSTSPGFRNKFWCGFNPATGVQTNREVTFEMLCDESVTGPAQPVMAIQNATNDCFYTIQFKTAKACGGAPPAPPPHRRRL